MMSASRSGTDMTGRRVSREPYRTGATGASSWSPLPSRR